MQHILIIFTFTVYVIMSKPDLCSCSNPSVLSNSLPSGSISVSSNSDKYLETSLEGLERLKRGFEKAKNGTFIIPNAEQKQCPKGGIRSPKKWSFQWGFYSLFVKTSKMSTIPQLWAEKLFTYHIVDIVWSYGLTRWGHCRTARWTTGKTETADTLIAFHLCNITGKVIVLVILTGLSPKNVWVIYDSSGFCFR